MHPGWNVLLITLETHQVIHNSSVGRISADAPGCVHNHSNLLGKHPRTNWFIMIGIILSPPGFNYFLIGASSSALSSFFNSGLGFVCNYQWSWSGQKNKSCFWGQTPSNQWHWWGFCRRRQCFSSSAFTGTTATGLARADCTTVWKEGEYWCMHRSTLEILPAFTGFWSSQTLLLPVT